MRTRENERQQGSCRERIKELFQALHVMFSPALFHMTMNTIYTYGMRWSPYNDREKKTQLMINFPIMGYASTPKERQGLVRGHKNSLLY